MRKVPVSMGWVTRACGASAAARREPGDQADPSNAVGSGESGMGSLSRWARL